MDNTDYNYGILVALYNAKKQESNSSNFNKPIIIVITSILECALYDLMCRIDEHRNEKIPKLDLRTISETRGRSFDVFEKLIAHIKRHDIFNLKSHELYDELDVLRKIRNRIHIQNAWQNLPLDEAHLFTESKLELAQKIFEKTIMSLADRFPRPWTGEINEFPILWSKIS